jgi:hypothetical protein
VSSLTVLYDACLLYPAPLRDLFMRLALTDLFRARWTEQILDEWVRNVRQDRPDLDPERLERTRRLMNLHVRDALVTGYEDLIPALYLPDPDDRHVLAAAIRCHASIILTFNHRDFPAPALEPYDLEVQSPDTFLTHLITLHPAVVFRTLKEQREALKNPPVGPVAFLDRLEQQGLAQSVFHLRDATDLI